MPLYFHCFFFHLVFFLFAISMLMVLLPLHGDLNEITRVVFGLRMAFPMCREYEPVRLLFGN